MKRTPPVADITVYAGGAGDLTPEQEARINNAVLTTDVGTIVPSVEALDAKADAAATTSALASKADAAATTSALASKADAAATTTALAAKINKGALFLNVKDYGAVGDGTTDDEAALQACLDAAAAATYGGIVYLPPGTYRTNGDLIIGSNTTIMGVGPNSLIKPIFASANKAAVIKNDLAAGNANIGFINFRLDRSGSNVQHGILLNGVNGLVCDGLEIVGVPSVTSGALAISGIMPGGSGIAQLESKNVRIQRCLFGQAHNFGVQVSYVTNCTITGNVFDDCYREAVGVEPEPGCVARNVTVSGNTFTMGTIPSGGSNTGVLIATTSSGGTYSAISFTGNTLTNTLFTVGNGNPGIMVLGASTGAKVTVTGNSIDGMNGPGIQIGNASIATAGVKVVGNDVTNCNQGQSSGFGGAGIILRQALQNIVMGNFVLGNRHTASIYETSSGTSRNIIVGNQLLDVAGPLVLLSGSAALVRDNLGRAGNGAVITVTGTYTCTALDQIINANGTFTITLPPVNSGLRIVIKNVGTGTITVAPASGTIDGAANTTITTQYASKSLYSDGTNWFIEN